MSAQVIPEPRAATMTTVDIDLLDNNGARWVGAKVQVTFVAPPHTPAPWLFDGAEFQMYYYFETIGPTGHFQIQLPSNLDVTPRGEESFWRFDIAPNIDDGRSVPITVQLSTSEQDLSQAFTYATSLIVQWPVQSIPVPRASGDFDVIITPNDGQLYFDVTMQVLKVWANGGWQVVEGGGGGGGGISYPPPGIAVSQGTAWGVSIDPATLATTAALANYLPLTGGTMTGALSLFNYTNYFRDFNFGSVALVTNSGFWIMHYADNSVMMDIQPSGINAWVPLNLPADPTAPLQAATKQYVDSKAGNYLPLTGGTVNGFITLNGDFFQNGANNFQVGAFWQIFKEGDGTPVLSMGRIAPPTGNGATTDNIVAFLPLFASRDPLQPLEVATKGYVDTHAGGATYPPAGIPVSTGSAWGTSLDPDNSYLKLTGGTVTGNIIMTGAGGTGLWMQAGVNIFLGDPYNYFQGLGGSSCMLKMNNNFYLQPWNSTTSVFSISWSTSLNWYTAQFTASTTINSNFTVTGVTTLGADPVNPLEAATKQYVDNRLTNGYLPLTGGTLTGNLAVTTTSFPPISRTTSGAFITGNPYGIAMVNSVANADQKYSYFQVGSTTSGTIHFGFQNDAGTQNHDYFTVVPTGNKSSLLYINSDIIYFSSGDASTAYGNIDTNGSLNIRKIQVGELSGSNPRHMQLTFDTTLNGGVGGGIIQCLEEGVAYTNTYINPNGGNIYIGIATDNTTVTSSLYVGNFAASGTKTFVITHPLDESKNLVHACLEGPENAVYYRGQGVTNDYGEAEISLPEYFEALTRPYGRTVILTAIYEDDDEDFGQVAASVVTNGRFKVRSQYAEQGFFWEVKAVRNDLELLEVVKDKLERVH